VVVIGGAIFGEEAVKGQIVEYLGGLIGMNSAVVIQKMIESGQSMATFSVGNILGLIIIWIAATNAFSHLKSTTNEIWAVPAPPGHWVGNWVKGFIFARIMSIIMILMVGILMLVIVLIDISLSVFDEVLAQVVPAFDRVYLWKIGNMIISFLVTLFLFAWLYKFLPDTKVTWGDVWPGAAISSFLFTIGKFLISLYLSSSQMISLFGAASSFVVILVWIYYSNQIFFAGVAFSHNYAEKFGSRARPVDKEAEKKFTD
jgi:membrane protein